MSTKVRRDCFDAHKKVDETGRIYLVCYLCGYRIDPARDRWEAEHTLRRTLGGSDAPDNVLPAHADCHKPKTAADITQNSKGKRVRDQHYGIRQSPSVMPGSKRSRWKKKINGEVVER